MPVKHGVPLGFHSRYEGPCNVSNMDDRPPWRAIGLKIDQSFRDRPGDQIV